MDSIFIFEIDRIDRIIWIICFSGFLMKPVIIIPLRGTKVLSFGMPLSLSALSDILKHTSHGTENPVHPACRAEASAKAG